MPANHKKRIPSFETNIVRRISHYERIYDNKYEDKGVRLKVVHVIMGDETFSHIYLLLYNRIRPISYFKI